MKNLFSLQKLAACLFFATATGLVSAETVSTMAPPPPTIQTYEFQYSTASTGFQPTYLYVTAALNAFTPAASSILNYQITTPDGVWTPSSLTGTGTQTGTPFWLSGALEVINGGQNLIFITNSDLRSYSSGPVASSVASGSYDVILGTTSVSDTSYQASQPLALGSTGSWVAVTSSPVPEAQTTLVLLGGIFGSLCLGRRWQIRLIQS